MSSALPKITFIGAAWIKILKGRELR